MQYVQIVAMGVLSDLQGARRDRQFATESLESTLGVSAVTIELVNKYEPRN